MKMNRVRWGYFLALFFFPSAVLAQDTPQIGFSDEGHLLVGENPFFAIGSYHLPKSPHPYQQLASLGFNLVRTKAEPRELERAHEAGLLAWVSLGHDLVAEFPKEQRQDKVRNIVHQVSKYPALLAWESVDRPTWSPLRDGPKVSSKDLFDWHKYLKDLDRKHPLWIRHAAEEKVRKLRRYSRGVEIVANQNVERMIRASNHQTVWAVLQDTDHLRFQVYQAALYGAQGILFWGVPKSSEAWERIGKAAREAAVMAPVFLALLEKTPNLRALSFEEGKGLKIRISQKQVGAKNYLIVMNQSQASGTVQFENLLSLKPDGNIQVLHESRFIPVKNGRFEDHFKGFEVHVYQWPVT